ncbi:capsular polysaccharide biosynthesis protein [Moraxella sp. VT-16-12]|uniref:capsular polysaccharide biosynthesis protein n=1 Tax=Moraxella sp. VT-16-12 TaxID=2014877 RepID=UPI000B7F508C|nr:capsular polysaccharide biosynthesis protein [Moraxella sp. VT-16-12]TWV82403.1 capsular polysaccharide biosynthesis protein [Moraxella sp. VT-16-12]
MSHFGTHFTTATSGILKNNPLLGVALGADVAYKDRKAQAVLAWGQKPSRDKAVAFAHAHHLPLITIEDGFLRSLGSGIRSVGASFIMDDVGVYFDLTTPNRLQTLIADCLNNWCDDKQQYAKKLIQKIITNKLSKYNTTTYAPDLSQLAKNDKPHVIIIDQVAHDSSVKGAGADDQSFAAMLAHAQSHYRHANIWIKAHPAGKGYFTPSDGMPPFYLTDNCNPIALLNQATAIYTVSSHMGFEALMLGKVVHNFGVNWYGGFGLTDDSFVQDTPLYAQVQAHHRALNIQNPSIYQLFYASYVLYSHYANPATAQACDIETLMDYLITNRDWQDKLYGNTGQLLIYEFSRWKVPFVRGFLGFDNITLTFKKNRWRLFLPNAINAQRVKRDDDKILPPTLGKSAYVVWGQKAKKRLVDKLTAYGKTNPQIWCMEDGFIRSNGLGATLIAPMSVVMDDVGIYFDTTAPSRLEQILNGIVLDETQKQRAKRLHELLLTQRVSKYNVPTKNHDIGMQLQLLKSHSRCVHLVVGQVEDDASLQNCASMIKKNSELLAKVRADFPQDIIIYKPHPDVEAGLRMGKADNHHLADVVAYDVAMPDCLDVCDVVHTISSLTGFEALLRYKKVVCYGLPFYAGFGLTDDVIETQNTPKIQALNRRTRPNLPPLTLDELIFGTLIAYPIYHLPHGTGLATPENVIDYLYNYQEDGKPYAKFAQQLFQKIKTYVMRLRNVTSGKKLS